jgi:hypothetical protein
VGTEFFSIFKADLNSQCVYGAVYAQCALEGGCDTTDGPCQNANQRSDESLTCVSCYCRYNSK